MSELEAVMLAEVEGLLARWQVEYAGRPDAEAEHLWLLALEREQIVAVAYREESVAGRVDGLSISAELRTVLRQTLVWIWKDEELHAEYLRGNLLRRGGWGSSMVVYGRQVQGALSGWVTATEHHRDPHTAPLRTGAASALVAVAGITGRIPRAMQHELHFQTFRRYCDLNVVLEMTAELAYRRLVELAANDDEREIFTRIRDDEQRHTDAFRVLAAALTDHNELADGWTDADVIRELSAISEWFLPASMRPVDASSANARPRTFGTGAPVVVRSGRTDADKLTVLEDCLDRAGLAEAAMDARTAAIRVSFMLGYDRGDRSNVNDPALVAGVAAYLHLHGVDDVAVLEAPTVYGTLFAHRSVAEVARYFGFDSPEYRVVDIGSDLRAFRFERGLVQEAISATWVDADLRIVMPKLRTDPTEFAHLSLSTLEGTTGAIDETFYANRRVDFRTATMMVLDVAPPDFAVVDAWAPVADGPFGVMGCIRPADVRHLYAGADALAVDEALLADLGVRDPRQAPIVARTHHWFGLPVRPVTVDGPRPPLRTELRGVHASALLRALGTMSYPIYVYLSNRGELFVPAMDEGAFPPIVQAGAVTRGAVELPTGIRPAGARTMTTMRSTNAQVRGVLGAIRRGHAPALALAVADSRALVRSLFLASAVRLDVLVFLTEPRTLADLAARTGATRQDRSSAWLDVGIALHELRETGGRYTVRGRRARALAEGDPVLVADYRSMLDYQPGPYDELAELIRSSPGDGRDDLDRHATVIAEVSRAAMTFVIPYVQEITRTVQPGRLLDAGCGTGVYLEAMLEAAPSATGDGVDLAPDVVDDARARLDAAGLAGRATVQVGDARAFATSAPQRYDLVTLLNNVYYFARDERVALYRQMREALTEGGELVVVTMVTPGSAASAHLNFMLVSQAGNLGSLPAAGEVEHDLRDAGFTTVETTRLVPTEPFVGVRARIATGAGVT